MPSRLLGSGSSGSARTGATPPCKGPLITRRYGNASSRIDGRPHGGRPTAHRSPAFAAPPVTETTHQKNLVETFVDIVPNSNCAEEGPLYTIPTTSNLVEHTTIFDDGRVHATFTQTATFVAVPLEDPSLPSYTGKVTIWGGFNANGQTVNGTFTFNLMATGSDGSTINTHQVDHFNVQPDGTVNEFFHCH